MQCKPESEWQIRTPWGELSDRQMPSTSSAHQRPTTAHQHPSTSHPYPSTSHQRPTTSYQHLTTAYQQPSTSRQRPITSYQHLMSAYQRPSTSYQQPSTSSAPLRPIPRPMLHYGPGYHASNVSAYGNPRASPVFLTHGRQDCSRTFQPLLALLNPQDYYYACIDLPGSGNSAPFPHDENHPAVHGAPRHECLHVDVPDAPNREDEEVTLILASELNRLTEMNQNETRTETSRPKIKRSFFDNPDKDFVVIQIEEDREGNQARNRVTTRNAEDGKSNLPANGQANAEQDENLNSPSDNGEWSEVENDMREFDDLTYLQPLSSDDSQNNDVDIDYFVQVTEEFERSRNKPIAQKPETSKAANDKKNIANTSKEENAEENKESEEEEEEEPPPEGQRRKRGIKLRKIGNNNIVCNDHRPRRCPFATSIFPVPSERGFVLTKVKKPFIPWRLIYRMSRGWAWRTHVVFKRRRVPPIDVPHVPVNSPASASEPETRNSPVECKPPECSHIPPDLFAWIHAYFFFKEVRTARRAAGIAADAWINNVPLTPLLEEEEEEDPRASPYALFPPDHPFSKMGSTNNAGASTSNTRPPVRPSEARNFPFPRFYNPMEPTPDYNFNYFQRNRNLAQAASPPPPQNGPSYANPRSSFPQQSTSSHDQPVRYREDTERSPRRFTEDMNAQDCLPSSLLRCLDNNEDCSETAEGASNSKKNRKVAPAPQLAPDKGKNVSEKRKNRSRKSRRS